MNPYKEDGPCARLSFDRAYCKRCTGPPSVNDGYITGTGKANAADALHGCPFAPLRPTVRGAAVRHRDPAPRPAAHLRQRAAACPARPACAAVAPRDTIAAIETLVRQRSNGAFIMRV